MKNLIVLLTMIGAVAWLGVGCGEKPQPKVAKMPKKHIKREPVVREPKPVKPPKEVFPGKLAYLDSKNGFRDATLGDGLAKFSNLVLVERDEARQLETYTRTGDILSIEDTPLTSIQYTFFRGQLAWITLNWKMEFNDSPSVLPPPSNMAMYCVALYGSPHKRSVKNGDVSLAWHGRRASLILNESRVPGVPDVARSRWGIPPTTFGDMIIESVQLRQQFGTVDNKLLQPQDGL